MFVQFNYTLSLHHTMKNINQIWSHFSTTHHSYITPSINYQERGFCWPTGGQTPFLLMFLFDCTPMIRRHRTKDRTKVNCWIYCNLSFVAFQIRPSYNANHLHISLTMPNTPSLFSYWPLNSFRTINQWSSFSFSLLVLFSELSLLYLWS